MKKLFVGFLILLFAVWLGFLIHRDSGYVLITYGSWSIETSLWVGIAILVLAFAIVYALLRIIKHTVTVNTKLARWDKRRKREKSAELTTRGVCQLIETNWKSAESHLKKGIHGSEAPLINYLCAAEAANKLEAYDRRDNYLEHAKKMVPNAEDAIAISSIRFLIEAKKYESALKILKTLNKRALNHPLILRLQKRVFVKIEDWSALGELLPRLRQYNAFSRAKIDELEETVSIALLSKTESAEALETLWRNFSKSMQTNAAVTAAFAFQAIHQNDGNIAINAIEHCLKKRWDEKLVKYYGLIHGESNAKQLSVAESWLKKYPEDTALLLCLGRLSIREKLWGKAKHNLETAIQLKPSAKLYNELARVHEALDEHEAALKNYRQAAQYTHGCPFNTNVKETSGVQ